MDWLTQLLSGLGPQSAGAAPLGDTFASRFGTPMPQAGIGTSPAAGGQIYPYPVGPDQNPMTVGGPEPSVGESINGPAPEASGTSVGPPTPSEAPGGGLGLQNALRGIQMMQPPAAQKVTTPHAPQARPIGSGNELVNLLLSLGLGPKDVVPGYRR